MQRKSHTGSRWSQHETRVLFGSPSLLFLGLIPFRVECIAGCLWRARCLDPRGATASSRLEIGFDCVKVISVSGKSALVSEEVAVWRREMCAAAPSGCAVDFILFWKSGEKLFGTGFPIYRNRHSQRGQLSSIRWGAATPFMKSWLVTETNASANLSSFQFLVINRLWARR